MKNLKKPFALLLITLMVITLVGCGGSGDTDLDAVSADSSYYLFGEDNVIGVCNSSGLWGFINSKGEYIVEHKYTYLEGDATGNGFNEFGLAIVANGYNWEVINTKGEILVGFTGSPDVEYSINPYSECGIAKVNKKIQVSDYEIQGYYGYIDTSGKMIIDFTDWKMATDFTPAGYANIRTAEGDWGVIDKTGKFIIEAEYDYEDDLPVFAENGLALKEVTDEAGFKAYGFVDTSGELKIDAKFTSALAFQNNGIAVVKDDDGYTIIDSEGKILTKSRYDKIGNFENGVVVVTKDQKEGLINEEGKEILKPKYDTVEIVSNQLVKLKNEGKYGCATIGGDVISDCKFESLGNRFVNSMIAAYDGESWGYLNKKGKWAIKPQFSDADDFGTNGYAAVEKDGKSGIIDKSGKFIIEAKYQDAENFNDDGIFAVELDRTWKLLNKDGSTVCDIAYEGLWAFAGDEFLVSVNDDTFAYSIIDANGKAIIADMGKIAFDPNFNRT